MADLLSEVDHSNLALKPKVFLVAYLLTRLEMGVLSPKELLPPLVAEGSNSTVNFLFV